MFVEISRLFIILIGTLTGLGVGRHLDAAYPSLSDAGSMIGGGLGTLLGYVGGGVTGRFLERAFGAVEERVDRLPAHKVAAGALGAVTGGFTGSLLAAPLLIVGDSAPLYLGAGFVVWSFLTLGFRLAVRRSEELFAMAGLSTRPLVRSAPYTASDGVILDTSAVMDGAVLDLVRSGFLEHPLFVPRFVLDELQGLADAREGARARRARRGLELLEALRSEGMAVRVLDDEVPEHDHVDAKLAALARRLEIRLLTCDVNLQRVAEVQGVRVWNLRKLAAQLSPTSRPGDVVSLELVREGTEAGQGVGYLEDGSMVVVNEGLDLIGAGPVEVEIAASVPTAVGRLLFAHPVTSDGAHAEVPAEATPH